MKKKAPRNKTISLTGKETAAYAARTVRLTKTAALSEVLDKTICQDALKALDLLPDACADLLIADPPYNLTKIFGKSTFKEMDFDAYKLWLDKWLAKNGAAAERRRFNLYLRRLENVYCHSRNCR